MTRTVGSAFGLLSPLFLVTGLWGCAGEGVTSAPAPAPTLPPIAPAPGWQVSTPEQHRLDGATLARFSQTLANGDHGEVHSLLVVRDGALVQEAYFHGYDRAALHRAYSVTKSVASALVGTALDRDLIRSPSAPLSELLPDYFLGTSQGSPAGRITLEQVLAMSAGFEWDEWSTPYTDARNPTTALARSPDWVQFMLERPLSDAPGTRFTYNSGCSILLSGVLQRATGRTAAQYAEESFFGPLGIEAVQWVDEGAGGLTNTGWGLRLRPLDMARIGLLYLRLGDWNGRPVLSEAWVRRSTSSLSLRPPTPYEYGYQWWRWPASAQAGVAAPADAWYASGWGGQYIFVVPSHALVVVFTAGNYDRGSDPRPLLRGVLNALR